MKNYIRLSAAALCFGIFVLLAPTSSAQPQAGKLQAISQQLNLTPQQKKAILSSAQYEKLKAIRQQAIQEAMQKRRGR